MKNCRVHPTHWLISTQAARATIGFRTAAAGHDFQDWPIVERKLPTHYDRASGEFKFEDGDGLEVDCVIYCTGYRHTFPFLDEPLQLRTPNRLAPDTLWKGIVHPDCTSLYFVGICVEIKILRRVRAESSRRPPRHRRDACSIAWWCSFLTARSSQDGCAIAEK